MTGILLACLAPIGFGASVIFARLGVQSIKPSTATLIALISSLSVLLGAALIFQFEELVSIPVAAIGWFSLIGILQFPIGRNLFFHGVRYIGAARATPVNFSYPLFTLPLAILFLHEEFSVVLLIGIALIVGGLILLVTEQKPEKKIMATTNIVAGYGLTLISAVSYGISMAIIRWGMSHLAPPLVGASVALIAGVMALSLVSGRHLRASISSNRRAAGMMVLSGLGSAWGLIFLYNAFARAPAVVVTPLSATSPAITLLLTHIFLKRLERVTIFVVLGSFFVVTGSVLVALG